MSLAADSPSASSGSIDDFAALLAAELEAASDDISPDREEDEEEPIEEDEIEPEEDEEESEEINDPRSKKPKLDNKIVEDVKSGSNGQVKEACSHPSLIRNLCALCGKLVEEESGSSVALGYIHKDLRLSAAEIERHRRNDVKNLLKDKKLILVLDLDHTLINSSKFTDLTPEESQSFHQSEANKDDPNQTLFRLGKWHMLTKLRPFVRTFLQEARNMFEMYIYTMGEKSYAHEIAKLLDPDEKYFHSKVISQSDCTTKFQKGLDVVLGDDNLVIILDDTEYVWQRHRDNLILMERYHYFASSVKQFNHSGVKSLSETMQDERESEGALANILDVLKRVHQMFFDPDIGIDVSVRDVRKVLKLIRQEILDGCNIVFSGVFSAKVRAEEQPIWKLAEQLGATCSTEVDSSVTHVVAAGPGTQKAKWAHHNGKYLVTPRWIEAAGYLWKRHREEDFLVASSKSQKN